MPVNTLTLILVFLLGVLVGGLVVSIRRASTLNRIREQFREDLEEELSKRLAKDDAGSEPAPPRSAASASDVNPGSEKKRAGNHDAA